MACTSIKKNIMFLVLCAELAVTDDPLLLLPIGGCRGVICKFSHSVLVYYLICFTWRNFSLSTICFSWGNHISIVAVLLHHLNIFGIYSLYSFNLYCLHVIFFFSICSYFFFKKSVHKYFQVIGICFLALLLSLFFVLHFIFIF